MTREDVERLLHCARHEAQGAGPNTLAEVCEWALEKDRLRRLGDHHHASCSMLAAQLVAAEKERDEAVNRAEAAEAKLAKAREALLFGANLLSGHRYHWEHEGDEESGQHDEDCRACEYEAMLVRFEAALSDEESSDV